MNYKGKHLTITMNQDEETTNTRWVFEILVADQRVAYTTGNDGMFDRVCRQVVDLGIAIHLRLPHCYKWFDGITTEHLDEIWNELGEFVASYCGSHTIQKYKENRSKLVMVGSTYQKEGEPTNPLVSLPSNVWINTIYIPKAKGWLDVTYELTRHPEQHTDLVTMHPGNHADDAFKRTKESLRRGVRSFKWVMRRSLHVGEVHGVRFVPSIGDIYLKHQDEIHRVLDIPLSIGESNMFTSHAQAEALIKENQKRQ